MNQKLTFDFELKSINLTITDLFVEEMRLGSVNFEDTNRKGVVYMKISVVGGRVWWSCTHVVT